MPRFLAWFMSAKVAAVFHATQVVTWGVMVPVSLLTGWVYSIVFVSLVSIWTAGITHWSGLQAALADLRSPDD